MKKHPITKNNLAALRRTLLQLHREGSFAQSQGFIQHGSTSVYAHSLAVAYFSLWLAERMKVRCHRRDLMKGALLHDYFLYDWHKPDPSHRLHGFTHPGQACKNAVRDYQVNPRIQNIISRHMFPLVPVPPTCREAWIVCLADKTCALAETLKLDEKLFSFIDYDLKHFRNIPDIKGGSSLSRSNRKTGTDA